MHSLVWAVGQQAKLRDRRDAGALEMQKPPRADRIAAMMLGETAALPKYPSMQEQEHEQVSRLA